MIPLLPNRLGCSRAREWVSLALDDQLDEALRMRLATHLSECEACRQHQSVLEQGRSALRATVAEPSENFEWKVQLGIQRALRERSSELESYGRSFWRPALASAAAVTAMVVGLGSLWLLDRDGPLGSLDVGPSAGNRPVSSLLVGAPATGAVPDLSGAVPGRVFEFDATRGGFGIRTVSRSTADPRFIGELYAPVSDSGRPVNAWASDGGSLLASSPGSTGGVRWRPVMPQWQLRSDGVQVLNLRVSASTFPPARIRSEATAETTAATVGTR